MQTSSRRPTGWLSDVRRCVATLLAAVLVAVGTGCFGSFPLTGLVYDVNATIRPDVLRQVVFWVFLVFPVYEGSVLGDLVVLNLLEFWTGLNLGGLDPTGTVGELEVDVQPAEDGRTAQMAIVRGGETVARARFVRVSDELCEVHSPEGKLLGGAVRTEGGAVRLEGSDGTVVATLSAEEIGAFLAPAR